jgi:N6-L-threonylcarbamoyladenine synthase
MIVMGIETSCDETACGIVQDWKVLANVLRTQEVHETFGGVVPEIASREHLRLLPGIVRSALQEAGIGLENVDAIAFTRGPGLAGPLLVGSAFARSLGMESGIPVYGANHLEGHLAAVRLHVPVEPPFLCLTVSGGHTELALVEPGPVFTLLGETRDDAAGEAFDKCGKLLGLGYPAGPIVSRLAAEGDRTAFDLPRAMPGDTLDFSFSGLKTAVLRVSKELGQEAVGARIADLCASLEEAIVDALCRKVTLALERTGMAGVAVCGGVSANPRLRQKLSELGERKGFWTAFPSPSLSTDNGAMIAAAALWRLENGSSAGMGLEVEPGLPLQTPVAA